MDYYVHFLGMPHIPEDKRGEYAERMLEIFRAGGLFDTVTVNLTGAPVTLLRVPESNANGVVKCRFSAFDLVTRNAVKLDTGTARLLIDPITGDRYVKVVSAALMLTELYSDTGCISGITCRGHSIENSVMWLNYLFDEQYAIPNRNNYWPIYKAVTDCGFMDYANYISGHEHMYCTMREFGVYTAAAGITKSIEDPQGLMKPIAEEFHEVLINARNAVRRLVSNMDADTSNDRIYEIISQKAMDKSDFGHMLQALRFLPKITGARIIAEETGTEFEELYSQMTDKLTYTTFTDDETPFPPLGKINTQRFLGVTADDMLYRINTIDEISPEIMGEIEVFKTMFSNVQKQSVQPISTPELFNVLAGINHTFGDVYMFEDTFTELLNNFTDSRYISLYKLLSEVIKQEKVTLERANNDDERTKSRAASAKRISRLLGIMANSAMRAKIFGF